uniref:Uncharacterized protein n=1 Tax=Anopheles albimanus TaxID=7167 RepID=A0A182FXX6_ANOAL
MPNCDRYRIKKKQGKLGWGLRKICWGLINITVPRVSYA